ncbi:MAG: RHS repeat-associated core domain-containing protein [Verrucomicrobiota bacterium]
MPYRPILSRFRNRWTAALQTAAMLCVVLQPLTVNSYWSDIDNDGDKDWVEDPPTAWEIDYGSDNVVMIPNIWWDEDSDGDQMTNTEEALFGSDPYRVDSDFDGLTDRDERDLTPPMINGVASTDPWLWDTDSDGYSDYDEFYNWLQATPLEVNYSSMPAGFTFISYYDADGDGIPNPTDSYPLDRDNDGMMDHEDSWPDDPSNYSGDDDADGHVNGQDSHRNDPNLHSDWDSDNHNLDDDSHGADPGLWSDWNLDGDNSDGDGDEDGIDNGSDSHPHNASVWDDWDDDGWGSNMPVGDSHPYDAAFWSDWDGNGINHDTDSDEDGVVNADDSHPTNNQWWYDWNGDGDENAEDWDEDGFLNAIDTDPRHSGLWCDWDRDGINDPAGLDDDGDGWNNANDSHIYDNSLWSDWNQDSSNDDTDGDEDGYANESDSDPHISSLWCDWDRNGINDPDVLDTDLDGHVDINDSHSEDIDRWSDWNEDGDNNETDGDEDGRPDSEDSHPRELLYWSDWDKNEVNNEVDGDEDGFVNEDDSHPFEKLLWSDWNYNNTNNDNDGDEDGRSDNNDSHPRSNTLKSDWNYDGDDNDLNGDEDIYLDQFDSHPTNPLHWSDWNFNGTDINHDWDEDGAANAQDSHPKDPNLWTDTDNDGYNASDDSHPANPQLWDDWDRDNLNDSVLDTDLDGLSNEQETSLHHTDPVNKDTDGDYLTDEEELLTYHTDPLNAHSVDGRRLDWFAVPAVFADTDGDGIPNRIEQHFGLSPADPADARGDLDGDGVTNLAAYNMGQNLLAAIRALDADDDGITNAMEDYYAAVSPGSMSKWCFHDAVEDADGDGLNNHDEIRSGLNPLNAHTYSGSDDFTVFLQRVPLAFSAKNTGDGDSDNDGLPDVWEHKYRARSINRSLGLDLHKYFDYQLDPDGDLYTNVQEFQAFRHPLVADRRPGQQVALPGEADPYQTTSNVQWTPGAPGTLHPGSTSSFSFTEAENPDNENEDADEVGIGYVKRRGSNKAGDTLWSLSDWERRDEISVEIRGRVDDCQFPGVKPANANEIGSCQHGTARYIGKHGNSPGPTEGLDWWQRYPDLHGNCPQVLARIEVLTAELTIRRPYARAHERKRTATVVKVDRYNVTTTKQYELTIAADETEMTTARLLPDGQPYLASRLSETLMAEDWFSDDPEIFEGSVDISLDSESPEDGQASVVPARDSAGPRYRKVGLNGMPMPDSKPQVQNENGEQEEETYIDAFTAQLRHAVTDVYATDETSLIPLMARRDRTSDYWSTRNGLHHTERPGQPFGPGWTSNLCSHVHFTIGDGNVSASVADEGGTNQRYVKSGPGYLPWIHDGQEAQDIKSFQNQFTATVDSDTVTNVPFDGGGVLPLTGYKDIVLNKKFGTVCTYEMISAADLVQVHCGDRLDKRGGYTIHLYARLKEVKDRLGNVLKYHYPSKNTLIPDEISDSTRPGHRILIQQEGGRITGLLGPAGDYTKYSYESVVPGGTDTAPVSLLTRVDKGFTSTSQAQGAAHVEYDYFIHHNYVADSRVAPAANNGDIMPTTHYYLEMKSIKDERGGLFKFTYAPNNSFLNSYNLTLSGARDQQHGMPMFLTSVESPEIGVVNVGVEDIDTAGGPETVTTGPRYVQSTGNGFLADRLVRVTFTRPVSYSGQPLADRQTTYRFSAPQMLAKLGWSSDSTMSFGYRKMTITAPDGGVESYYYDNYDDAAPFSSMNSMLLTKVLDRNNRSTTFAYTDFPLVNGYRLRFPYDDPTKETAPDGTTKVMAYHPQTRLLQSTTAPRSASAKIITSYAIDTLGRRTSEALKSDNAAAVPGGYKKTFTFGPTVSQSNAADFPGFIASESTDTPQARGSGDPTLAEVPVQVLTRAMASKTENPKNWWRTISETVVLNGQNSTNQSSTTTWYDYAGNKRMIKDPRGHVTRFDYDNRLRLVRVTHPDGTFKSLDYDAHGNVVREIDEAGVQTFHVYDSLNRRTKTTLDLNRNGVPDAAFNPMWIDIDFDLSNLDVETPYEGDLVTETTYNLFNLPATQKDTRGIVTKFEYDLIGRLVKTIVNWKPELPPAEQPTAQQQISVIEYKVPGLNGGIEAGGTVFDVNGFKPVRLTDVRGFKTSFEYDTRYRPVREIRPDDSVVHRTYDLSGQVTSVSDPSVPTWTPVLVADAVKAPDGSLVLQHLSTHAPVTWTSYDALGLPRKVTYTDLKSTTTISTPHGKPWKVTDETGQNTFVRYNSAGLPVKTILPKPDALPLAPETSTAYDLAGNVSHVINPRGHETRQIYDSRNRLAQVITHPVDVTSPNGSVSNGKLMTVTKYDAMGRPIAVSDPAGATTRSIYDGAGRLLMSIDAMEQPTRYTYDGSGNVLKTKNALNQVITNSYTELGFLSETSNEMNEFVYFLHDLAGNRTMLVDQRGKVTNFTYDAFNRLTSQSSITIRSFTYHTPAGGGKPANYVDKATETAPGSLVTTYEYDLRHRLLVSRQGTLGAGTESKSMTYHPDTGRLSQVAENTWGANGTSAEAPAWQSLATSYSYDKLGQVLTETNNGRKHTYVYDAAGNRTQSQLATGQLSTSVRNITTVYDALNRPQTVTDDNATPTTEDDLPTQYGYDRAGRAIRQVSANGQITLNQYDLLGRLKKRTLYVSDGGEKLAEFNWTHDALGNVLTSQESWNPGSSLNPGLPTARERLTTMTYDHAGRLDVETITDSGTATVTTDYGYDAASNRTTKHVTLGSGAAPAGVDTGHWTYTYSHHNELLRVDKRVTPTGAITGGSSYTYDVRGNRTSKAVDGTNRTTTYQWTGWDKLAMVKRPVSDTDFSTQTYTYDYRSRRTDIGTYSTVATTPATPTMVSVLFSGGLSVGEFATSTSDRVVDANSTTGPEVTYARGPDMGGGVGGLLHTLRGTTRKYNLSNGRGDIVAQSDSSGALTWTASYEAFGKRTKETGTNADKQRANTKDEDPTGLLNEGFRYRDIETGVFLSRDPAGFVDGPNLYAYVKQNPWSTFDPDGLKSKRDYRNDMGQAAAERAAEYKNLPANASDRAKFGIENRYKNKMWAAQQGINSITKTARAMEAITRSQTGSIDDEFLDDEDDTYVMFNRVSALGTALPMKFGEHVNHGEYGAAGKELAKETLIALAFAGAGKALAAAGRASPAMGGVSYRLGSPVTSVAPMEWAMMSYEQRIATVVEKYGINLKGRQVVFDPKLGTGQLGMTAKANPMRLRVGEGVMSSETELASTIAHELRHSRAYMGSGSNSEAAATASEDALRGYIQGQR